MASEISWEQLDGVTPLPDGDLVTTEYYEGKCPADQIQIGLKLLNKLTWWKGVALGGTELASVQDDRKDNFSQIPFDDLKKKLLHLWKAQTFGVHTDTYILVDPLLHMVGGNQYNFLWLKD
jgi:hypothetical protein